MHDAVGDQIVILTMIEHGQIDHAGILDRAPHDFVILNTVAVVRDRRYARLRE